MLQGGWMDWKAFLCMSGQLSNTPSPSALCPGSSLPVQLQGQGAEPPDSHSSSSCPQPCQHHPPQGFAACQWPGCVRKTGKDKEVGASSSKAAIVWHYHLREAFCNSLPLLQDNGRGRLRKSRAWAIVRYFNDKHMEVCPARAHPPVQILGQVTWCLASSFKRVLFIYSSQEFGAVFF